MSCARASAITRRSTTLPDVLPPLSRAGSVRFADEQRNSQPPHPAAAPAAPAAVPKRLEVRLGFLQVGGIYCTDLLQLEEAAPGSTSNSGQQQQQQQLQPEVCGLTASNLSVGVEQRRLVLRLWAEREGPLQADFTLALAPDQQVRPAWGACRAGPA